MKCILYIVLYSLVASSSVQFEIIKIGAIFFANEVNYLESFNQAILEVNGLDNNVRIEVIRRFLAYDDSVVLQKLACELIGYDVSAIFGPSSKATSDIVQVVCNITGIPNLQFDGQVHGRDFQRRNHQLTVNVAPSDFLLSVAFADIIRSSFFNWKSFTIVYERESSLTRVQQLLAWKQLHKSGIKMREFTKGDDYRILWKLLSTAREKFIVLDCPSDIIGDVMNASKYFNMTGPFNVRDLPNKRLGNFYEYLLDNDIHIVIIFHKNYFLINLDTHMGDLGKLYSRDFTAAIAAVRIRNYVPPVVGDEVDVFEDEEQSKFGDIASQLIYDSVILFYTAVLHITTKGRYFTPNVRCGHSFWKSGPEIVARMKSITWKNPVMPFKTQKMHFNDRGQRDDFNLDVYNPFTERVTYVWNKVHLLVPFELISENASKKAQKRLHEEKEDFSQGRVRYTVATRIGAPYFMWRPEPEGEHYEGNERFEGYAVDLIYKLAEECRFDFDFQPVADNGYGNYDPITDEWNGIVRELIDNNAQIGICDLTITQARRSVVDFTVPFMQLGISILQYRTAIPPKRLFAFLEPFSVEVWLNLLMALMVTSLILLVLARISHHDWEIVSETENEVIVENKWNLLNTLWLMIGSILTAGCDILPRGGPMRVVTAFWWIFAMILSQTYIAKLASFITSQKMEGAMTNLHDLVVQNKVQFGTVRGGSTSLFFSESNDSDYRVAWNKMIAMKPEAFTLSNKEGVDRVKRSEGRYAFLMETTNLQYYLQRNCELAQIGEPFGEKHYGIAVPLNAPFRSNLSVGILKLSERGVLYTLKNKWFNNNESTCGALGGGKREQSSQFTMESLRGLFLVLISGIVLGILIAIGEFLWYIEGVVVRERVPFMLVLKSELQFFLRFWLTRKRIRTYSSASKTLTFAEDVPMTVSNENCGRTTSLAKRKDDRKLSNRTAGRRRTIA